MTINLLGVTYFLLSQMDGYSTTAMINFPIYKKYVKTCNNMQD